MAGYTRQSVASIINGANITAPPLNAEFNQILAAFSGVTGHTHTGGTGDAPQIPLATSVSGYLLPANGGVGGKNSNAQSSNPGVGDDNADGYAPGSIWLNGTNNRLFVNLNNSTGAAVWSEQVLNNSSNQILPHTDDTVDLGSSAKEFKDLYIDGTAYVDSLNADSAAIGSTLGVTGAVTFSSTAAISSNTTVGGTLGVTGATTLADNLSVTGNTTVSGNTSLNGNTTVGNASSDTITFTGQVASDFIPSTDGTHDLGSSTKEWQDLFIDGTANIDSLVADTADINGGTIDGSQIGGTVQSSGQFSTVTSTDLTASGAISFAAATISNLGTVTTANIDGGTIDGVTLGASSPITNATIDNININGSAITSTNSNGNIAITPDGSGEVDISKVDIDSGTIDGTAIGGANPSTGAFTTISTSGLATLSSVDINGGTIDGAVIGGSSAQAITGTTITANTGFVGGVTGNVTGNLTGNVTGNVTGDLTGDVTGNITASSGTSTVNNLVVNGTANFTNTPLTNISDPSSAQDAATKNYVDTQVSGLVDSAPGTLDTLNELAAALGDDPNFSTTITNSIATKLPLAGGTMSGAIAMGTSKITGLGDPTANQDASTKNYTDTQDATKLNLSGGTMSGAIAMGTNKITGTGDPTSAQDVATKNYIDTLFGSTTAAASSASAAATSETNAASSATASASSATASANSASASAASYDQFDDRYLGAKSSAPTVDNDGDALVIGALYFDTTSNSMKVYSSGGWVSAGSSVNGTSQRYDYVVGTNSGSYTDSSTTTFPATYDAGFVDIYLNGVKLVVGTDVTASSGTNVVLASPAATGDNICIVGYGTFNLASFSIGEANNVDLTGNANNAILAFDSTDSRFEPTLTPTLTSLTTTGSITTGAGIDVNGFGKFNSTTAEGVQIGGDNSGSTHIGNLLNSSGALTLQSAGSRNVLIDAAGDIILDADGDNVYFKAGGGNLSSFSFINSDVYLGVETQDKDLIIRGNDGGSTITALTLDMSAAGKALFNSGAAFNGNVDYADNAKIIVGSGDDLQIYHDANNSFIDETGTGHLYVKSNSILHLMSNDIRLMNEANSETILKGVVNGAVELYHDNSKKIETTSSGVDVAGNITLTNSDNKSLRINSSTANAGYLAAYQNQAIFSINRDGKDGAFADTGKAAAVLKLKSADADSSIELQTTTSNNAEPITRVTIDKDGAASFTGTIKTSQNYRPAAALSSGTGNNVNYWKLGNIEIHSSHGAILTVFGTASYSNSTSIAGRTTIILRGGNSSTVLDGYFFGESEGNGTCNDVVWKNTASNKFDIWVKYGSTYAGLDVSCHGEGVFTAGISDTGSTSAPSGSSQLNSEINFLTAGVSRMRISSSGTVRYANHIAKTGNEGAQFVPDSVGRDVLNTGSTSTGSVGLLHFFDPNGFVSAITTNGGQAQYGTGSDYRLKENLNYSWDASTELKKIKPVKFNYINHKDNTIEGFIAHELQEVVPNAVVYDKDATLSDGSPRYQMVDHSKLVPLLTKSIQEQQIIIDDLKARIETLETEKVIIEESSEEEPKTEETEKVIIEESSDEEPKTEETGE